MLQPRSQALSPLPPLSSREAEEREPRNEVGHVTGQSYLSYHYVKKQFDDFVCLDKPSCQDSRVSDEDSSTGFSLLFPLFAG